MPHHPPSTFPIGLAVDTIRNETTFSGLSASLVKIRQQKEIHQGG